MSEYITVERRGHVLVVGLNRPQKRNAFDLGMFGAIGLAWAELDRDDELRCAVLHAAGAHFTGGLDLAEWAPAFAGGKMPLPDGAIDPLGLQGPPVRKPVVCAVQGICFTIGIELMLACDVRVAARDTRFGQIEIKRGIYPVGGATIRMPRELGWGNAMRWLLTGDPFDAAEALRIGLVTEVTAHDDLLPHARGLAGRIAANPPLAVRNLKAGLSRFSYGDPREIGAWAIERIRMLMQTEDHKEGVAGFLEKRQPVFQGR